MTKDRIGRRIPITVFRGGRVQTVDATPVELQE